MKALRKLIYLPIFLVLGLASCHEDVPPLVTEVIKAIAGEDQEVSTGTEVFLNGAAEGASGAVAYEWSIKSKPEGSLANLIDADKAAAKFTPDLSGVYLLELKVSKGDKSHLDAVSVSAITPEDMPIFISEDIQEDRILEDIFEDPYKADYIISNDVTIKAKLTIKPGVTVKFQHNKGLIVGANGVLSAKGTSSDRIIFTGIESEKGYWKGIFVDSNSDQNELSHVLVSFGGSSSYSEAPEIKANIILNGSDISASTIKVSNSSIMESDGYGLYLKGMSNLNGFAGNNFSNNKLASAYVPANKLHLLDFHTNFSDNNGFDGVETGGELNINTPVKWTAFNDGSRYLVSQDLKINSGLMVMEGATFEMKPNTMIEITESGYMDATGSDVNDISFLPYSQSGNGYWRGIVFKSASLSNKLIRTEVSFAGTDLLPGLDKLANVAVANTGRLLVRNSKINEGRGYGIVASNQDQLNTDVITANTFYNLPLGSVYPTGVHNPETPSLIGNWVDWWSFTEENYTIDPKFYDRSSGVWFKGAADPWNINSQQGFGIQISDNGSYVWTIAERHQLPQCLSYSAEFITGTIESTLNTVTMTQDYWRSKFVNNCAPDQNSDQSITPGDLVLRYEINKVFDPFTGRPFWELKFFNPDNSTFSYFRP